MMTPTVDAEIERYPLYQEGDVVGDLIVFADLLHEGRVEIWIRGKLMTSSSNPSAGWEGERLVASGLTAGEMVVRKIPEKRQ